VIKQLAHIVHDQGGNCAKELRVTDSLVLHHVAGLDVGLYEADELITFLENLHHVHTPTNVSIGRRQRANFEQNGRAPPCSPRPPNFDGSVSKLLGQHNLLHSRPFSLEAINVSASMHFLCTVLHWSDRYA